MMFVILEDAAGGVCVTLKLKWLPAYRDTYRSYWGINEEIQKCSAILRRCFT